MSLRRPLTTRQVADRLGVNSETVLRRWRRGELPGYRLASNVLRFDEAELDAYLAALTGPSAEEEVAPVPFTSPGPARSLTVAPVPNRGGDDAR
jgi:excisionase family DNA binding protein